MRPLRVGLTGGVAAGKSTAAAMFAALGVPVLDLDAVGRRVLEEDDEARAAVAAAFPEAVEDGRISRARLAGIVFADPASLRRLEAILHPRIWRACEAWLARQRAPYAVVEAPALLESGARDRVDRVVVVLAPEAVRRARARARGGAAARLFSRILAAQVDDRTRRRAADFVLVNDRDRARLQAQVRRVHEALLAEARGVR